MLKALFKKRVKVPSWIFLMGMSLYVELLLHFWTNDTIALGRLAAVVGFALAFGGLVGLICSFFPPKAEKWIAVVIGFLMVVLWLLEFFLDDAYGVFMPLISVFATAEGVATGYFSTIVSLLVRSLWRIGLVLLPVVLYAVFATTEDRGHYLRKPVKWKKWLVLTCVVAVLFAASFGIVYGVKLDVIQLTAYNFDGAIHSFGLNMSLAMDLIKGSAAGGESLQFEIPEVTDPPVETTLPVETTEPAQSGETVPGTEPPATSEPTEPTEPPRVYEPHAFDLDFTALAEAENNSNIANLHRYLATLTPAMENEYTGMFEGKNLILITAEAFSGEVIDPEMTPTLYRMVTEGIHFTDYYHPLLGAGTTGGEFANLVGVIPYNGTTTMEEAVEQNLFLTMGNQLQELGYTSAAFHNNDHTYYNRHQTHTHLGYDTFFAYGNGMEELISNVWTRSDLEMVDVTLPQYIDKQPFSLYYMTVSGHSHYGLENAMSEKNYHLVEDLPYSYTVKCYIACQLELEFAMESMIRQLEEAGIADDTVIVLTTDHYPYGLASSTTWGDGTDYLAELYGVRGITEKVRDRSALIIWSGCLEDKDIVVDDPVWCIDILPTLSNLFGLEYDSRLMIGRDVFSDSEPLVFWPMTYSWKTDKGSYDASIGKFTPAEGVEVDETYVEQINSIVRNKVTYCRGIQWYNYFNDICEALGIEKN